MSLALQLDMFAPRAPQLPVARVHPINPRAFDSTDCHRELIDCGSGAAVTLLVARCAYGMFRCSSGYTSKTGGIGGPVFESSRAFRTFGEARAAALLGLVAQLRISYSNTSDLTKARIIKVLEGTPLDFWQVSA